MPATALTTFMDVPYIPDLGAIEADIVVQGAPFDLAVTGKPGTRFGPEAIRTATRGLQWEPKRWPWEINALEQMRVVDRGNVAFPHGQTAEMARALEEETFALTEAGRRVLTLGGDHFITLPLLKAHHRRHGPLALVQLDAHCDTDDARFDHHGVMFHRAVELGLVDGARSVQAGIRTWYDPPTHRLNVLDADWVTDKGPRATADRIREIVGEAAVYLSFDIDCLDPAFAPGTGTPVIGGLTSNLALQTLRALRGMTIAGADLVEVSPPYDPSGITALAGATIALEIVHLMVTGRH